MTSLGGPKPNFVLAHFEKKGWIAKTPPPPRWSQTSTLVRALFGGTLKYRTVTYMLIGTFIVIEGDTEI